MATDYHSGQHSPRIWWALLFLSISLTCPQCEALFLARLVVSFEWVISLKISILCLSLSSDCPSHAPLSKPTLHSRSSPYPTPPRFTVRSTVLSPLLSSWKMSPAVHTLVLRKTQLSKKWCLLCLSRFISLGCELLVKHPLYQFLSSRSSYFHASPMIRAWFSAAAKQTGGHRRPGAHSSTHTGHCDMQTSMKC